MTEKDLQDIRDNEGFEEWEEDDEITLTQDPALTIEEAVELIRSGIEGATEQ